MSVGLSRDWDGDDAHDDCVALSMGIVSARGVADGGQRAV